MSERRTTGGADREAARAYTHSLRILARSSCSVRAMSGKLRRRGFAPEAVGRVLERLRSLGYLDDERYARDWASAAVRLRHFAAYRIARELRLRGIERHLAEQAAREAVAEPGEAALAEEAVRSRVARIGMPRDRRSAERLIGYLTRRGFSRPAARAALRTCGVPGEAGERTADGGGGNEGG